MSDRHSCPLGCFINFHNIFFLICSSAVSHLNLIILPWNDETAECLELSKSKLVLMSVFAKWIISLS